MRDFEIGLEEDLPRGLRGEQGSLVDAKWLDKDELADSKWRYRDSKDRMAGLVLGYRELGGADLGCGWSDNRHVLTVAGSRAGKGVSLIVPNLLLYDGSVLAIDPKGELARVTARARREKGQKVVILDPFGENKQHPTNAFNPLAELDPASDTVKDDAGLIADALIVGNERDPHWTDSARILVKGLILYALTLDEVEQPRETLDKSKTEPETLDERHLVTVWKLLTLAHHQVARIAEKGEMSRQKALWRLLKGCDRKYAFADAVASAGERFEAMQEKELQSVLSSALTQLEFLDSDKMANVLTRSDLNLSELKTGATTLYLCLPATRMGTHSRWLRVIINLALIAFERTERHQDIPVLMVLDEFPVLGHMQSIETAAGLIAGFGVKLWVVLQDLTQVKRHYKDSWETFISNAGVATFWGNTDKTTLGYISERLGQTGVRVQQPTGATPSQRLGGASGIREELRVQRLLAEDEAARVLAREKRRLLVLAAGQRPVILQRIIYHEDKPFEGLFDSWKSS